MISLDVLGEEKISGDWSEVFEYREDLESLKNKLDKLGKFEKIIVVGNGGSITSYDAYFWALCEKNNSKTIWTMDPDVLSWTRDEFKNDGKTVVVAVSKSGNTLGQIESLLFFKGYPTVVVTNPEEGALSDIAKKLHWTIIPHPPVGGRFSGGTSSAFVPAYLNSMDVDKIQKGIIDGYKLKQEAFNLASFYFNLESKGYNEVYITCYSEKLSAFENLIIQLMHESVCKEGKGQTFYFAMGPEAQHHTNQRFLGGKRNVIGTFIVAKGSNENLNQKIDETLKGIDVRGDSLEILDGISYQKALNAEYLGTKRDADSLKIPNATVSIDRISEQSVGEMVSFWHMVAFYSAILRDVDPFDQPAVENSKKITLEILKSHS